MMSKSYLVKKGVSVEERNVSNSKEHMQFMINNGYNTTPIIFLNGSVIKGYKPQDFDLALDS